MDFERNAVERVLGKLTPDTTTTPCLPSLDIQYVDARLTPSTVALAEGAKAVSLFVTDHADAPMITKLHERGVELIVERFAGTGNVDREKAAEIGIIVAGQPEHCPESIAEYTITLLLTLARNVCSAADRFRGGRLTLVDMLGTELKGKTIGVIGTGEVGIRVVRWLRAFDCRVIAFDIAKQDVKVVELGGKYVPMNQLLKESDAITLHAPLVPATVHLLDDKAIAKCKRGVLIINTARGALVHNRAVIEALHNGQVGAFGLDVLEGETDFFFDDNGTESRNSHFVELVSMKNCLLTIHQAQSTLTATTKIARGTINALKNFFSYSFNPQPQPTFLNPELSEN